MKPFQTLVTLLAILTLPFLLTNAQETPKPTYFLTGYATIGENPYLVVQNPLTGENHTLFNPSQPPQNQILTFCPIEKKGTALINNIPINFKFQTQNAETKEQYDEQYDCPDTFKEIQKAWSYAPPPPTLPPPPPPSYCAIGGPNKALPCNCDWCHDPSEDPPLNRNLLEDITTLRTQQFEEKRTQHQAKPQKRYIIQSITPLNPTKRSLNEDLLWNIPTEIQILDTISGNTHTVQDNGHWADLTQTDKPLPNPNQFQIQYRLMMANPTENKILLHDGQTSWIVSPPQ